MNLPSNVEKIINTLNAAGFEAYAVGGCVRDALLNRTPGDWDITTSARPEEVRKLFKRTVPTGMQHGTITVLMKNESYEVTTYRIDGDYEDARHPKEVTFVASLAEDLKRRDFTINAMAYHPDEGLIDLFDGRTDLEAGIIRAVGQAKERFTEDALRMLRAVRFAAQLNFGIEEETAQAIRDLAPSIERISAERVREELVKLITSDHPEKLIDAYEYGITKVVLPEFDACMETAQNTRHHCYDVGRHTVRAMQEIRPDALLRVTMLLHDISKPEKKTTDETGADHFKGHAQVGARRAEEILRRLRFDNVTIRRATNLIYYHDLRIAELTPAKVRKAIYLVGEEDFPLLFDVKRADTLAQSDYMREEKLAHIAEAEAIYHDILNAGDCLSLKQLAVTGNDLQQHGIPNGRRMGDILYLMLMDVLDEPERNDKSYLLSEDNLDRYKIQSENSVQRLGKNFDENHTIRL